LFSPFLVPSPLQERLVSIIRSSGPITVARFMEIALYDPQHGYYMRAPKRSGKEGDFFTSVDVGPLFGTLIAEQLVEMWELLRGDGTSTFDLVEAAAGNGRLSRDILDAAAAHYPEFYRAVRLTLVERSPTARRAQRETLGPHFERLASSAADLPETIHGTLVANELLDALPVHVIEMTDDGAREIVIAERGGQLVEAAAAISNPSLLAGLPPVEPGERIETSPAMHRWIGDVASSLARGFLLLFDYTYEPSPRYLRMHPHGTLMSYRAHRASADNWLHDPGERDLTAHVNIAALRQAARAAGLTPLGVVDQTYFLLSLGLAERLDTGDDRRAIRQRLAARTLMMPGGLGDTMKAMMFGKGVGTPALRGLQAGRQT
jgi:SAM-dependent MidA family methyltransferase